MGQALEKVKNCLAELDVINSKAEQILAEGQCFTLKDLTVNGWDVVSAGIEPGPEVGQVLNGLLEQVLSGNVPNERSALLKLLNCKSMNSPK